jgi:hypothetical protein
MEEPAPPQWTRETNWRQGHVLPHAAAQHFALFNAAGPEATCVVVISHDCDLANDSLAVEPEVEVIVGRVVANENGNYTWGKAPRTLHYDVMRNNAAVYVELVNTSKRAIPKSDLAAFEPDPVFSIDGKALAVLRSWLGARYNRAAFPDAFVNRMQSTEADKKLAKALKDQGQLISFVYFDLDGGQNVERKDGDPYELNIVMVFVPGDDPEAAADEADKVAESVEKAVRARLKDPKVIVLKACFPISEDDLPVSRARILTQWRLEYMTLKADEVQTGPPNL